MNITRTALLDAFALTNDLWCANARFAWGYAFSVTEDGRAVDEGAFLSQVDMKNGRYGKYDFVIDLINNTIRSTTTGAKMPVGELMGILFTDAYPAGSTKTKETDR